MEQSVSTRPKIPSETQENILYAADHRCSKCHGSEHDVQIHHIDGEPANNLDSNLIVLCLNCHSEVERKGGLGKAFSAGELWRYRTSWEHEVGRQREQLLDFDAALAVFEIKKLSNRLQAIPEYKSRLDDATEIVWNIYHWCELADRKIRGEAASAVYAATIRVMRDRASREFVDALSAVLNNSLPPSFNFSCPYPYPIDPADQALIEHVANSATNLVNSACNYVRDDPSIAEASFHLLGNLLRLALLNDLTELQERLESDFKECMRVAWHPEHIPLLEEELRGAYEATALYKTNSMRRNHDEA